MTTEIILVLVVGGALVLVWGHWYALNHAALHLRVDDYGLKSPGRAYDTPRGVTLVLRDAANGQLAVARSVEPLGYILAVHPRPGHIAFAARMSSSAPARCGVSR